MSPVDIHVEPYENTEYERVDGKSFIVKIGEAVITILLIILYTCCLVYATYQYFSFGKYLSYQIIQMIKNN
jgi:hypothetical protein